MYKKYCRFNEGEIYKRISQRKLTGFVNCWKAEALHKRKHLFQLNKFLTRKKLTGQQKNCFENEITSNLFQQAIVQGILSLIRPL